MAKVIGVRNVSFKGSDGRQVDGYSVFYTYKGKDMLCGECADKAFISQNAFNAAGGIIPNVGDEIEFVYNRFGKIAGYSLF